jgi:hypothetical protein
MNEERIYELRCKAQELAAEAFPGKVPFDPNPDPILWDRIHVSYEKFAELIVQRTLDIVEAHTEIFQSSEARAMVEHIKHSVKTDFGVEE